MQSKRDRFTNWVKVILLYFTIPCTVIFSIPMLMLFIIIEEVKECIAVFNFMVYDKMFYTIIFDTVLLVLQLIINVSVDKELMFAKLDSGGR